VGTQGQFWMILVSHGVGAVLCFVAWFVIAFLHSVRRKDLVGLVANTVLLVAVMELLYYGSLPYGLPILMTAAARATRPPELTRRRAAERRRVPVTYGPAEG